MRNQYFSKNLIGAFVVLLMLVMTVGAQAQVRVPFTQRTSQYTPTKKIYNVRGDFAMIGNTNMTLQNYGVDTPNSNNTMVYVDTDGVSSTLNSSSATLQLSTENGAVPNCSNIIYAGLYWTGRASDGNNSPDVFTVTKNNVTKTYNKRVVSIKGPASANYTQITANTSDIYYPQNADGFMYSAYAEVTDYVKTNGLGAYTVADIALIEGNGGSTGYYGGWSLIVVYENSKMKYRDVTIFDGHAYVAGNMTADFEIPVAGFNTVQAGPVNMKLGLMAGEGDRGISGDYFQIRNAANSAWVSLNHSGNSTGNFFNSSIATGGNARTPNLVNNTGLDISVFNIPNNNNSVMTNNQTSTRFRYGTTQDTFVIFAVAMAVDAYIPEVESTIAAVSVNGAPAQTPLQSIQPGQETELKIQIRNRGTEAINNYKITVPIPYNAQYVANSAVKSVYFTPAPTPNVLTFEPTIGSNGSLVWDFGTLPLSANPETVLAELTFKLRATTDCTILKNITCSNVLSVDGVQSGTGGITGINFNNKNLIQGYTTTGSCQGNAIAAPILVNINAVDYVNQNCQEVPPVSSFVFCSPGANIPITAINGSFPGGSLFYNSFPVTQQSIQYNINNPFPATVGTSTYYAIPPNAVSGCYFQFTITVTSISSQPTVTDVQYCVGATAQPLTATPSNASYTLYYFTSPTSTAQLSITPSTAVAGTTTYYVAEGQSAQCIGPKKPIVVTVYPAPIVIAPTSATVQGCGTASITGLPYSATPSTITLQQFTAAGGAIANVGSIGTYTISYQDSQSGTCPVVVTRTFSVNTVCGATTATQTITVQDTTPPVLGTLPAPSTFNCIDGIPSFATPSATDSCSEVTLTSQKITTPGVCAGTYTIEKIWTAVDACGNISTTSQIINVVDNAAPVIDPLPAPTTISCSETPNFAQATATDACGSAFTLTYVDTTTPGACAGSYTITRMWTAQDACGNASTASQVINFIDNVPPVIAALPAPSTVSCPAVPSFVQATATDNCGGNVTLTFVDTTAAGTCANSSVITRTWTATDSCNNSSTATQVITVIDETAPVITTPASNQTANCDGTGNQAALQSWLASNGGAVANDACGAVTWTNNFSSLGTGCDAAVTVTFTATDACGNIATTTATFSINDTTAPTAPQAPAAVTVACAAEVPAAQSLTATDNCGEVITAQGVDSVTAGACANSYVITRTWTFTDACGNSSSVSQTINVNDTVAPTAPEAPASVTVACAAEVPAAQSLTATDNCGDVITAQGVDSVTAGACANSYVITRTWTFADACGNSSSVSQTINVNDTVAPTAPEAPASVTVACAAEVPASQSLTATDNCGDVITAEGVDTIAEGQCANSYVITRTWTFTDACGNSSSVSQTINVNDTVAPTFNEEVPANITLSCDAVTSAPTLTATDNCSTADVTFNETQQEGNCAGAYELTRTWTATDACGNTTVATQVITVIDFTSPTFDSTPEAVLNVSCENVPAAVTLTATDNCSEVLVTFDEQIVAGSCAGNYTIIRTWTANDLCKNGTQFVQTINVTDTTGPSIVGELIPVIEAGCEVPPVPQLTFTDNCSSAGKPVYSEEIVNQTDNGYTIIRTWTVEDGCGNESAFTQTVNVTLTPTTVTLETINACGTATIDLNAQLPTGAPASGTWSEQTPSGGLNGSTFSTEGLEPGSYTVQYIAQVGVCSYTANLTISVAGPTSLTAYAACNNPAAGTILDLALLLPAGAPADGIWTDVSGSGGLDGATFNASGLIADQVYNLQYTAQNGNCPFVANLAVTVDDDCIVGPCGDIVVHNAFSPNNDGINESFVIEGIDDECIASNSVEIYNRWGVLIYETKNYNNETNYFKGISEGRVTVSKNELLPTGTYFWIYKATTDDGKALEDSGYLYLSR